MYPHVPAYSEGNVEGVWPEATEVTNDYFEPNIMNWGEDEEAYYDDEALPNEHSGFVYHNNVTNATHYRRSYIQESASQSSQCDLLWLNNKAYIDNILTINIMHRSTLTNGMAHLGRSSS
jgi:hypothetical protein